MRILLSPLLLVLTCTTGVPAQTLAYHGVTSATHQSRFSSYSRAGYRIRSLSIYGNSGSARRYAAVWHRTGGVEWRGFHDMPIGAFQGYVNTMTRLGYTPTILTTAGVGASATIAGVFEKDGVPTLVRHGLTAQGFHDRCAWALDNGYRLTGGSIYGTSSDPRFVGIWKRDNRKIDWYYSIFDDATQHQRRFSAYASVGIGPALVTVSNYQRYLAIWHDDRWAARTARHGQTAASYQSTFNTLTRAGYLPLCVHAGGAGSGERYTSVFVRGSYPLARRFQVTGTSVPALAAVDNYVRGQMVSNHVRAATLAVCKDGKLVHARGYTYAEPGYPVTQPTSLFRVASITKPLTSIAIHRAIEDRKIAHSTRIQPYLGIRTRRDLRVDQITVDHLLTHRGGWDIDALGFDPMFRDEDVAARMTRGVFPVATTDIQSYMMTRYFLRFAPGSKSVYSNFGFALLGHVLQRASSGLSVEQIIQRDVFAPVGVTRARVGRSLRARRAPGEVQYHARVPVIGSSVMSSSRPWVPNHYGGFNVENMAGHGAWIMSAPDLAKVLGSFDMEEYNPLLCAETAGEMTRVVDPAKWPQLARGWYVARFKDARNVSRKVIHHNGALPGTNTVGLRRDDGLSVVLFFNRDIPQGLHAGTQGLAINNLLNAVAAWPTHDLFPSVGLPSFRVPCPRLTQVVRNNVPNVSRQYFEIRGENLQGVTSVEYGTRVRTITSQSEDLSRGWFERVDKTRIRVYLPQALVPAAVPLRVRNRGCASNAVSVTVTRQSSRVLVGPLRVRAGQSFRIFAARGASPDGTTMLLGLSDSPASSVLPGFVSLSLGAAFSRFVAWPSPVGTHNSTGAAQWLLSSIPSMRGSSLYMQAMAISPTLSLPLPVTTRLWVRFD